MTEGNIKLNKDETVVTIKSTNSSSLLVISPTEIQLKID